MDTKIWTELFHSDKKTIVESALITGDSPDSQDSLLEWFSGAKLDLLMLKCAKVSDKRACSNFEGSCWNTVLHLLDIVLISQCC